MANPQTREKPHTILGKIFHWGFILVFAYGIVKQVDDVDQLADAALLRFEIIFAAIFLALVVVRYFYMRFSHPSSLPPSATLTERRLARAGHLALYAALALIAISGLMIAFIYQTLGANGVMMDIAIGVHEFSLTASYVLIAGHIVAAIYHRYKGDGVWDAMVPVFKENQR